MSDYIIVQSLSTNQGWHSRWFHLKNDEDLPLPEYAGKLFDETPQGWKWGPRKED